jgi:hypothetical protein
MGMPAISVKGEWMVPIGRYENAGPEASCMGEY